MADQGHRWAVVQSLDMICGHEFHRLTADARNSRCRVSIGHSLLCGQQDHMSVARALTPLFNKDEREAVVLVGHGTDHCIWTAYPAFYQRLRQMFGPLAYGGMVEEDYPGREILIDSIIAAGYRRVRLAPFMLVAGVHFEEDLADPEDSWKTAFEARGLDVVLEAEGLGTHNAIIDIFAAHIQSALSMISRIETADSPHPCR